jgi:hypothetical protein
MLDYKKNFRAQVAPSQRQLIAIGMVAVQWSQFEGLITLIGQTLLADDQEGLLRFNSDRSVKGRIETCEKLAETHIREPFRAQFLSIFRTGKDLQFQRDRIIHNQWSGPAGAEAVGVFNWVPPHQPFDWKLDFGGIMGVAHKIDDLQMRLFSLFMATSPEPGSFVSFSQAIIAMKK